VPATVPSIMGLVAKGIGRAEVVDDSSRVLCARRRLGFVGAEHAFARSVFKDAFLRVRGLIDSGQLPVDLPVTLTLSASDDIPLSPAFGRETGYIGVYLSTPRPAGKFEEAVRRLEQITIPLGARPHWGKMNALQSESLARHYPRWQRFQHARARLDPTGLFRNAYLDRVLGSIEPG